MFIYSSNNYECQAQRAYAQALVSCGRACRTTFFLSAIQKEGKKITVRKKSVKFYERFSPCETQLTRPSDSFKQGFSGILRSRKPYLNYCLIFFRRIILNPDHTLCRNLSEKVRRTDISVAPGNAWG